MGKRYLIDSNAIIDFCNGKLPITGKSLLVGISPEISIITCIELFASKDIPKEEYTLLEKFVSVSIVHLVSLYLIQNTISIRQNNKFKLPDAIIAATCLTYNLILISRNTKDFKNIEGLEIIDPYLV